MHPAQKQIATYLPIVSQLGIVAKMEGSPLPNRVRKGPYVDWTYLYKHFNLQQKHFSSSRFRGLSDLHWITHIAFSSEISVWNSQSATTTLSSIPSSLPLSAFINQRYCTPSSFPQRSGNGVNNQSSSARGGSAGFPGVLRSCTEFEQCGDSVECQVPSCDQVAVHCQPAKRQILCRAAFGPGKRVSSFCDCNGDKWCEPQLRDVF